MMELTKLYLVIVRKAAEKANSLHDTYGSWKKIAEETGYLSMNSWKRIANGSKANTPRIATLLAVFSAERPRKSRNTSNEDNRFWKVFIDLSHACEQKIRRLVKARGKRYVAEALRVDERRIKQWSHIPRWHDLPEFRYLLAIDSLELELSENHGSKIF